MYLHRVSAQFRCRYPNW